MRESAKPLAFKSKETTMLQDQWFNLGEPAALWSLIAVPFILLSSYLLLRHSYHFRPSFLALTSLGVACILGAISLAQPVYVQKFSSLEWLPRNFVTIMDDSGSMSACFDKTLNDNDFNPNFQGSRNCDGKTMFDYGRMQLLDFASKRTDDRIAVTLLSDKVHVLSTLSDGSEVSLERLAGVKPRLAGTNILPSLEAALKQLESLPAESRVLLIVSDAEDLMYPQDLVGLKQTVEKVKPRIYWVHTAQRNTWSQTARNSYPAPQYNELLSAMSEMGTKIFSVKDNVESAEALVKIDQMEAGRLTHTVTTIMAENVINYSWLAAAIAIGLSFAFALFAGIARSPRA